MISLLTILIILLLALIAVIVWGAMHAQALAWQQVERDERDAVRAAALAEAGVWPPYKPGDIL